MAKIIIQSDTGEELLSVVYETHISADGNEIVLSDPELFAILKAGLPGPKGVAGDPGATEDWLAAIDTLATRGEDGIIPLEQLPAASGGGGSGGGEVTKIARLAFAAGTATIYEGALPLTVTKEDEGGYVNTAVPGTFKAPTSLPPGCMIRLTHSVEFSTNTGIRTVSFLRNGSAAWAGTVVRNLSTGMERESVAASAWFFPVAGEVYSLSVSGGQPVVKGDTTWFQIEVVYDV